MKTHPARWLPIAGIVVIALALSGASAIVSSVQAGTSGTFKLMVRECYGSGWLVGATIDVTIYRPGVGTVDSGSGITNSSGYVEVAFDDLEDGDEAHVTVTPEGETQGSFHKYLWVGPEDQRPGRFDISGLNDSQCEDGWYDQSNDIILCLHG